MYAANPELKKEVENAVGYATFRQTDVNLLLVASGNGYGVLTEKDPKKETFMRIASLGGGVGMGVKDLRVIFIFTDKEVMKQFLDEGWQFGGKADAAAKYRKRAPPPNRPSRRTWTSRTARSPQDLERCPRQDQDPERRSGGRLRGQRA